MNNTQSFRSQRNSLASNNDNKNNDTLNQTLKKQKVWVVSAPAPSFFKPSASQIQRMNDGLQSGKNLLDSSDPVTTTGLCAIYPEKYRTKFKNGTKTVWKLSTVDKESTNFSCSASSSKNSSMYSFFVAKNFENLSSTVGKESTNFSCSVLSSNHTLETPSTTVSKKTKMSIQDKEPHNQKDDNSC